MQAVSNEERAVADLTGGGELGLLEVHRLGEDEGVEVVLYHLVRVRVRVRARVRARVRVRVRARVRVRVRAKG